MPYVDQPSRSVHLPCPPPTSNEIESFELLSPAHCVPRPKSREFSPPSYTRVHGQSIHIRISDHYVGGECAPSPGIHAGHGESGGPRPERLAEWDPATGLAVAPGPADSDSELRWPRQVRQGRPGSLRVSHRARRRGRRRRRIMISKVTVRLMYMSQIS